MTMINNRIKMEYPDVEDEPDFEDAGPDGLDEEEDDDL